MSSRTDRVADVVADEVADGILAILARYHGRRVRDLDPVLVAGIRVEAKRKARKHLPLAVAADAEQHTPLPLSPAEHSRLTRPRPMGERDTPLHPIDIDDLNASHPGWVGEETQPGWSLPAGVARDSRRPTKPNS